MKFPKTLYVKIQKDGNTEYFTADTDPALLVDMGETVAVATYEMKDVRGAKGVAQFGPAKRVR